ncbi:MAG: tetratricopeptide repeat protein [Terrimicrobiaceae bacterium]|nr:tetratricopeptide repeat protein [Terrimicrobiaceae bacterium]
MRAIAAIAIFVLSGTGAAFAIGAKSAFDAGDYAGAAKQAEQELAAAPASAEGFYNLGLAYEKSGSPVKAALNYERALLLDPGLKPARNALALLATAKSIPLPPSTWKADVNAAVHPETLIGFGTTLVWAGAFGLLLAAQGARRRSGAKALAIVALIGGGALFAAGWLTDPRLVAGRPAMVAAREGAEVLSAPANNSTEIVSLPAGAPLGVLSPRGAWTYVALTGGARGWVQTDRLAPVVPGEAF